MISGRRVSTIAILVLVAFAATLLLPVASFASTKGRQNTAVALTAAAIAAAIMGKKAPAIVLGGGAAYAWKRHGDAREYDRHNRYRHGYYRDYRGGYGRDYRAGYGRDYGRARYDAPGYYGDGRYYRRH